MPGILLVDDAAFMRMLLRRILTEAGLRVVGEAKDGSELLMKYPMTKPDLVFLDIVMPPIGDMRDGVQVLRRLISKYPDAKVIMCSSLGHQGLVKEAIATGAKDYIVKPFRAEKVVELASKYCPR